MAVRSIGADEEELMRVRAAQKVLGVSPAATTPDPSAGTAPWAKIDYDAYYRSAQSPQAGASPVTQGPDPGVSNAGAPSPLTPELQTKIDAANKAISGGDTAGAAAAVQEASSVVSRPDMAISPVQAVQNVQAVQSGQPAVNTASPTGLWTGPVSQGNPAQAPTSVIASTATPEQAANAAAISAAAPGQVSQVLPPAPVVEPKAEVKPTASGPVAGGTSLPGPMGAPGPAGPVAAAPPAPVDASPAGPMTYAEMLKNPSTLGTYQDLARQALEAKYGPQRVGIMQNLDRSKRGMESNINAAQRAVLGQANRMGRVLWGTTTQAQANVAGNAMEGLQQEEQLANQRIEALTSAQQSELLPMAQSLFENDRNFQENVRQFGLDYALREATTQFNLKRGESLLPYELTGADLSNQSAALGVQRQSAMNPIDIAMAALGLSTAGSMAPIQIGQAQANLTGTNLANQTNAQLQPIQIGQAQANLYGSNLANQTNTQLQPIQVGQAQANLAGTNLANQTAAALQPYQIQQGQYATEGQRIANEMASLNLKTTAELAPYKLSEAKLQQAAMQLEYDIANDPNIGTKAQKQAALDKIQADIAKINKGDAGETFTAWQQYQMLRDEKADTEAQAKTQTAARDKLVNSYLSTYNINPPASDAWVDYMDIASTPKADGSSPNAFDLDNTIKELKKTPGLTSGDQSWLQLMHWSTQGGSFAQDTLNQSYRKKPISND